MRASINLGEKIYTVTAAKHLIAAGVSNWGAQVLAAAVAILSTEDLAEATERESGWTLILDDVDCSVSCPLTLALALTLHSGRQRLAELLPEVAFEEAVLRAGVSQGGGARCRPCRCRLPPF